jgi:hypothetical protein
VKRGKQDQADRKAEKQMCQLAMLTESLLLQKSFWNDWNKSDVFSFCLRS